MNRVEDGDHGVLLQVLGWSLLAAGQVADEVPHSVISCEVKGFLKRNSEVELIPKHD